MSLATPPRSSHVLLICGGLWHTMLGIPLLLHRAGCKITLVCPPAHPASLSRFIGRVLHYTGDNSVAIDFVRSLLVKEKFDHTIWTDESMLRDVIRRGDDPVLAASLPVPPSGEGGLVASSKAGLAQFAPQAGVSVPASRVCHTVDEAISFLEHGSRGDAILKPLHSAGGGGVMRVKTADEIRACATTNDTPFLIQDYITGKVGVTEMVMNRGQLLGWIASWKTANLDHAFGPSTRRVLCAPPDVENQAHALGRLTQFTGFCGFDFIEDEKTGKIFVLEFHPRPTAGFMFALRWGANLHEGWNNILRGTPVTQIATPASDCLGAERAIFPAELQRLLKTRDAGGLLKWSARLGPVRFLPWQDPGLIAGVVRYSFYVFARRRRARRARTAPQR